MNRRDALKLLAAAPLMPLGMVVESPPRFAFEPVGQQTLTFPAPIKELWTTEEWLNVLTVDGKRYRIAGVIDSHTIHAVQIR